MVPAVYIVITGLCLRGRWTTIAKLNTFIICNYLAFNSLATLVVIKVAIRSAIASQSYIYIASCSLLSGAWCLDRGSPQNLYLWAIPRCLQCISADLWPPGINRRRCQMQFPFGPQPCTHQSFFGS